MNNILEGLNEEQAQAVTSIDGHVRVIAGAGSGKTKALVHRYAYLVNECGVAPGNILSVTFTNKAAQEMKSRIRQMIGDNDIGYICTFHGLCVRILREDIHYLNYPRNFTILDQDDQKTLLADVYEELGINKFTHPYSDELKKIALTKNQSKCDYVKQVTNVGYYREKTTDVFDGYLKLQRKNYALDFTDLIEFTFELFTLRPDVLEKWQKRFQYIQVDEFQDVSTRENELVSALAEYHNNLFIVGDPDQTKQ